MIHGRPARAPEGPFDLVVVGGGAYGAFVALEAARRGLRPLLLERADFGGATTRNSLRIVHGGLRYLQSADLGRFRRSVAERRWMLRAFPELVRPLRCVMPLDGRGLRRRPVLRAALLLNDVLSLHRNRGVRRDRRIPRGRILDARRTRNLVPDARADDLRGGAVWFDAEMVDASRLLQEILRWATACGAVCLNYVDVQGLLESDGRAAGVTALDRVTGERLEYRARAVVNCAGPWAGRLAERLDRGVPGLFRPSLAFNLLLRRPVGAEAAVAATPPGPGARTYFVRPWKGFTLAGTFHAPRPPGTTRAEPEPEEVEGFLADLRAALPGFDVTPEDVRDVMAGLLPVRVAGTVELEASPAIHDHGAAGGPAGLFSVRGVKYTTARRVAEETLERVCAARGSPLPPRTDRSAPETRRRMTADRWLELARSSLPEARSYVEAIVREEAVLRIEDLLDRRTDWGLTAPDADAIGETVAPWIHEITGGASLRA